MPRTIGVAALLLSLIGGTARGGVFLDVTSVTPGGAGIGSFTGTLGTITVTGSIFSGGPASFFFNAAGPGIGNSTTDGSSPQFSYSSVFSPTVSATDRVGFTYTAVSTNFVTLTFSSPVTDPVFHVANLDWAGFSFAGTPGFTSLTLLNGNNGPDSDGIDPTFGGLPYSFAFVRDLNPTTSDSTLPIGSPPTSGPRSADASVQINGTFSTLNFATDAMGPFSDSGSFTISVVPEPSSMAFMGIAVMFAAKSAQRRLLTCFAVNERRSGS